MCIQPSVKCYVCNNILNKDDIRMYFSECNHSYHMKCLDNFASKVPKLSIIGKNCRKCIPSVSKFSKNACYKQEVEEELVRFSRQGIFKTSPPILAVVEEEEFETEESKKLDFENTIRAAIKQKPVAKSTDSGYSESNCGGGAKTFLKRCNGSGRVMSFPCDNLNVSHACRCDCGDSFHGVKDSMIHLVLCSNHVTVGLCSPCNGASGSCSHRDGASDSSCQNPLDSDTPSCSHSFCGSGPSSGSNSLSGSRQPSGSNSLSGNSQPSGLKSISGTSQPSGMKSGASHPSGMKSGASHPSGMKSGASHPSGMKSGASHPSGMKSGASHPSGMKSGASHPSGMKSGARWIPPSESDPQSDYSSLTTPYLSYNSSLMAYSSALKSIDERKASGYIQPLAIFLLSLPVGILIGNVLANRGPIL